MRVEEDLKECEGALYTRDLVVQDCNSYIKQVTGGDMMVIRELSKYLSSILKRINC